MFFGTKLGVLSPDLVYTDGFAFTRGEQLLNLGVLAVLAAGLYLLVRKFSKKLTLVLVIGTVALVGMGGVSVAKIINQTAETKVQLAATTDELPTITLSKEKENVVVIMLDRGISSFVPYIMEENSELKEQFDGFTFYANTLAYGGYTNFATPALYGGYDYTPAELNERDTELLADKHDEALKVVPTLFTEAGYDVTLIDPSYAGYQQIPDLSIYEDMPGVKAYLAEGKFNEPAQQKRTVAARKRNFFLFSLMKTMPLSLQSPIYNNGEYRAVATDVGEENTSSIYQAFLKAYNVLKNLSSFTEATDSEKGTYTFLRSNSTHEATVLQEPDFEPAATVDNSAYYPAEGKTITDGENSVLLSWNYPLAHYHANMASLMKLGDWFDKLRKLGVYDNTRIIIVSDHGRDLGLFDQDSNRLHDIEFYQAMLLVKDFDSTGFTITEDFMTNADVAALSLEGIVENPVNPFTGNPIAYSDAEDEEHHVIISSEWDIQTNKGTQFFESEWATVSGDVRVKDNWTFSGEASALPPNYEK